MTKYRLYLTCDDNNTIISFYRDNQPMKFSTFVRCLDDEEFVTTLTDFLLFPDQDYFLESSAIASKDDAFILILTPTNDFTEYNTNWSSFDEHLHTKAPFVAFSSLGGDTELIVPNPRRFNHSSEFINIFGFLANTCREEHQNFFSFLGTVLSTRLKEVDQFPLYLKTHGLNVPYFHFRLQHTPKYYVNSELYLQEQLEDAYM